ncbi:MAG: hypothetical protein ACJA1H_003145 [Glaciecola sp.]|jgi:hypothetical protein
MGRKVKYSYELKLHCVKHVLNQHQTVEDVSKLYGCHHTTLYDWIRFYKKYGKRLYYQEKITCFINCWFCVYSENPSVFSSGSFSFANLVLVNATFNTQPRCVSL